MRNYAVIDAGTMINWNVNKLSNNIAHQIGKMLVLKIQGNFIIFEFLIDENNEECICPTDKYNCIMYDEITRSQ